MLPKYEDIQLPLLREIALRGGRTRPSEHRQGKTVYEALAEHFKLTTYDLSETVFESANKTYRSKWENMVRWTRNDLVKKCYINNYEYGVWALTDAGWRASGMKK